MLYMSCSLVVVVCSILCVQTTPLPIASLGLTTTNVVALIPLYALGAHKLSVIELSVGTELVPMLLMFFVSSVGQNNQSA